MSNVIAFRPQQSGPTKQFGRPDPCSILLFTGVRYMRDQEAVEPEPATLAARLSVPSASAQTERLKA